MNKLLYTLAALFVSSLALAQTTTENYVKTTTYQVETLNGTTLPNSPTELTDDEKIESITYYDGLGRAIQSIAKQAGANKQDIITPIVYDGFGRQIKDYLPYVNGGQTPGESSLAYRDNSAILSVLPQYYQVKYPDDLIGGGLNVFSEKVLEASPLNRVMKQAAPGYDWAVGNGHTIKFDYQTNIAYEVRLFNVSHPNDDTEQTQLVYNGHYPVNSLYKTITKDENWTSGTDHTTEEFMDKQGRVVLKRTYNLGQKHDTFYVYDDFGNLTYVIPPLASDQIVDSGPQGFRIASQINYPWTQLVAVDETFAEDYNKRLIDYKNEDILNADLENEYGGQGGFTVTTLETDELVTLSISFSANQGLDLKLGELVSLRDYGTFKDTELGRISGTGYEYVFLIKNNAIVITGGGKVSTINQTFSSSIRLNYSQNYPWTAYTDIDSKVAADYEDQLKSYANSDILNVIIPNIHNGQGGLNISIDEYDAISVTINSTTTTALKLKNGIVIPLNAGRSLLDRDLGTLSGVGYSYDFSIIENSLFIEGTGTVTSLNGFFTSTEPTTNSLTAEGLCYIYHYDNRNRLIEKKIPGKGWEHIVYDKLDRPVLTQDAKMRLDNDWLFTKYDVFGRVLYTGKHHFVPLASEHNSGRLELQEAINAQNSFDENRDVSLEISGTQLYYSNTILPNTDIDVYTVNYYDDYPIDISGVFPNVVVFSIDGENNHISANTESLPTGSKVRVLGTNQWIISATYYDEKARPIYSGSENAYLGTTDIIETQLDFIGKPIRVRSKHTKNGISIITKDTFSYDHTGRLLTQSQLINDGISELIVNNHYDELGQLNSKHVGGAVATAPELSTGLQTIDYNYNIRGWLKAINNGSTANGDLFGFKLNYNVVDDVDGTGATPLFNGNISETHWVTANDNNSRSYDYSYDALNRINIANYHGTSPSEMGDYSLNSVEYDKNGNITNLNRTGLKVATNQIDIIDELVYDYGPMSNQLKSVSDTASEDGFNDGNTSNDDYVYDINGNMTQDVNKNIISIEYNHLNLPTKVEFSFDEDPDVLYYGAIEYIYDATGMKLQKKVSKAGNLTNYGQQSTLYAANFVYDGFTGVESLKFFNQPEGYIQPDGNGDFEYIYQYKDHLGNIRLSYADTNNEYQSLNSSAFDEDYEGWIFAGGVANGNIELENERLKVNVKNEYNGVYIDLGENFTIGDQIEIRIDVDKGNTNEVRMFLVERDASDTLLGYHQVNQSVSTGSYTINHTVVAGSKLRLKLDKSNVSTDLGMVTYFYIDNVFAKTGNLEIIEENNYYPFGLKHKGYNNVVNGTEHKYKYNGKEIQEELGLDWYDYGARNYEAALGRFFGVDKFAERFENLSPYQYANNTPTYFIDKNGEYISIYLTIGKNKQELRYDNKSNKFYYNGGQNNGKAYLGKNSFVASVTKALVDLESGGDTGKKLVSFFADNKNKELQIGRSLKGNFSKSSGKAVGFNPSSNKGGLDTNGKNTRPSFIGLGHELAHAQDTWQGLKDISEWFNVIAKGGKKKSVPKAEIYATYVENLLREENGLSLREYYTTTASPKARIVKQDKLKLGYYNVNSSFLLDRTKKLVKNTFSKVMTVTPKKK